MSRETGLDGSRKSVELENRLIRFGAAVCGINEELPSSRVGNHVAGQLMRCSVAPAALYGEAQGAESRKDFIHKMKLCLKELREAQVWLKFVREVGMGGDSTVESAILEADELISIFVVSLKTAERNARSKVRSSQ